MAPSRIRVSLRSREGTADEPHAKTPDPPCPSQRLCCLLGAVGGRVRTAAGRRVALRSSPDRLLRIYLTDHLAAGTAGVALARRAARSNSGTSAGEFLHRLSGEIAVDLETLRRVVSQLGFTSSRPKEIVAAALEKVARLKPNGQLRGYSPLSRVLELEALSVGIAGKLALWQSLQGLPALTKRLGGIDLEDLIERARRQREEVEEHRQQAAGQAFVGGAAPPPAP